MKIFKHTLLLLLTFIVIQSSYAQSDNKQSDREQINQTMSSFFKWDLEGGVDNAEKALSKTVLYHRLNEKREHVTNTPNFDWEGKGKNAHEHNIVDVDIYKDMAVVTVLLRYNPQSASNTYMKTFILYKLAQGWRVTNVTWGSVKNTQ